MKHNKWVAEGAGWLCYHWFPAPVDERGARELIRKREGCKRLPKGLTVKPYHPTYGAVRDIPYYPTYGAARYIVIDEGDAREEE